MICNRGILRGNVKVVIEVRERSMQECRRERICGGKDVAFFLIFCPV